MAQGGQRDRSTPFVRPGAPAHRPARGNRDDRLRTGGDTTAGPDACADGSHLGRSAGQHRGDGLDLRPDRGQASRGGAAAGGPGGPGGAGGHGGGGGRGVGARGVPRGAGGVGARRAPPDEGGRAFSHTGVTGRPVSPPPASPDPPYSAGSSAVITV